MENITLENLYDLINPEMNTKRDVPPETRLARVRSQNPSIFHPEIPYV